MSVRLAGRVILRDINLHMHCGELTAIVGPNGAGKTTLLRALLGEIPFGGRLQYSGRGRPGRRPRIGYVPQKVLCDPAAPLTVADFLTAALGHWPAGLGLRRRDRARAAAALRATAAEPLLDYSLGRLSGGEIQRVLLAAALTPTPDVLLLDEPGSAVDAQGQALFYELVCDLRRRYDVAVVLVSHDLAGIARHADRLILLNQTVLADGPPAQVLRDPALQREMGPALWRAAQFASLREKEDFEDQHDGRLA